MKSLEDRITDLEKRISILEEKDIRFKKPTMEELSEYCLPRDVDPEKFYNFYEAKGWKIGKNKMKSWKAAVRTWMAKKEDIGAI